MPVATITQEQKDKLSNMAKTASKNAYAPYSKLSVGAAVLTSTGKFYSGANVENASYGLTICAERSAIFSAVAAEGPEMRVRALAVYCNGADYCPPCGACRQVLAEFGPDAFVTYGGQKGWKDSSLGHLLPERFDLS